MKYLITGASSGLGLKLAVKLLNHGDVIGLSRKHVDMTPYENEFNYIPLVVDLSVPGVIAEKSDISIALLNILQNDPFTLVINAASFYSGEQRLNFPQRNKMFCVNIFSVMDLVETLRQLNMRRIFFVNSISGLTGQKTQHEYSSSKHALMGYVRSLIKQSTDEPYDIMSINPGGLDTNLWSKYPEVNRNNFLDPDEIADLIAFMIKMRQRVFVPEFVMLPSCDT